MPVFENAQNWKFQRYRYWLKNHPWKHKIYISNIYRLQSPVGHACRSPKKGPPNFLHPISLNPGSTPEFYGSKNTNKLVVISDYWSAFDSRLACVTIGSKRLSSHRDQYVCENPHKGAPANNKRIFGVAILASLTEKNLDYFWQN